MFLQRVKFTGMLTQLYPCPYVEALATAEDDEEEMREDEKVSHSSLAPREDGL